MTRKPVKISGAIVGLGRIGFGFNLDAKRRGVWTHERAFELSGAVRLAGVVEPDEAQAQRFAAARPEVPVYASLDKLLEKGAPDLISICTPTSSHGRLVKSCARAGVRAIFCEKPLAETASEAIEIIAACRGRTALAVNHTRRWDPRFQRAAELVRRGKIGEVKSISARYSARIFNMGTHLIDAIRMVTNLSPITAVGFCANPDIDDPDVSGVLDFGAGKTAAISCNGRSSDLLFEIDVVGTEGRLRLIENGQKTAFEAFRPSTRYGDYRELAAAALPAVKRRDRFIEAVRDICACLSDSRRRPACTGEDGLSALAAAQALVNSAKNGSMLWKIDAPERKSWKN